MGILFVDGRRAWFRRCRSRVQFMLYISGGRWSMGCVKGYEIYAVASCCLFLFKSGREGIGLMI